MFDPLQMFDTLQMFDPIRSLLLLLVIPAKAGIQCLWLQVMSSPLRESKVAGSPPSRERRESGALAAGYVFPDATG